LPAVPPGVHLDPRYFSGQGEQKNNAASTLAEGMAASLELVTLPNLFNLV
jgi:hypothetical protein